MRPPSRPARDGRRAVPGHDRDPWMTTQPRGQGRSRAVGQEVEGPPALEVHHKGPPSVPLPPRPAACADRMGRSHPRHGRGVHQPQNGGGARGYRPAPAPAARPPLRSWRTRSASASASRHVRRALGATREGTRSTKVRREQAAFTHRSRRTSKSRRTGRPRHGKIGRAAQVTAMPGAARPPASGTAPTTSAPLDRQHEPAIEFSRRRHPAARNPQRLHHDLASPATQTGSAAPLKAQRPHETTKNHPSGAGLPKRWPRSQ